ncbi:MAG: hypothetical protein ACQBVK_04980 [Candidatus Phytoplasma sp. TWB_XP]
MPETRIKLFPKYYNNLLPRLKEFKIGDNVLIAAAFDNIEKN